MNNILDKLDHWLDQLPEWLELLLLTCFFTCYWAALLAVWIETNPNN